MGLLVAHEAPTGEALLGGFRIVTPKWTPFWGPHYRPGSLERWVAKTQGPAGWPAQSHAAESQRSKECNQAQEPFGQGAAQISEGESFQFTARARFCANSATFNPILLIVRFFVSPLGCVYTDVSSLRYAVRLSDVLLSIFWVALSQNLLLRFQGIWCQVTRPRMGWWYVRQPRCCQKKIWSCWSKRKRPEKLRSLAMHCAVCADSGGSSGACARPGWVDSRIAEGKLQMITCNFDYFVAVGAGRPRRAWTCRPGGWPAVF